MGRYGSIETSLPYRQTLEMSMKFTEASSEDLIVPVDMMIFLDMIYADFNNVEGIVIDFE